TARRRKSGPSAFRKSRTARSIMTGHLLPPPLSSANTGGGRTALQTKLASREGCAMADQDAARYRANLQGEVDGAALYRVLADAETDPRLKEVYGRLAAVEEGHAEFWRKQLDRIGARAGRLGLGWRTRALAWLARRFGPQFVLPTVNTLEQ